jgi:hypothetical protein
MIPRFGMRENRYVPTRPIWGGAPRAPRTGSMPKERAAYSRV